MIGIGTAPLPSNDMRTAQAWNDLGGGVFTISLVGGSVMSVTPSGGVETRPPGANGPWEQCTRQGNIVYFCPDGVHVYAFAFAEQVPA